MLQHFPHLVFPLELFGIDPHALAHEEGVIAHPLAGLNFEALQQLIEHQIHHPIQTGEEIVDVAIGLDGQPGQVDGGEAQIAAAVGDFAVLIIGVADDPGAAAHVGDFRLGMAGLVILQVEGRILE